MLSALATLVSVCTVLTLNVLDLPDHRQLAQYTPPQTTRLYAVDGALVREYYIENRVQVAIGTLPDYVPQAFISAEDQDFREHAGVDPSGLARATLANIRNVLTGRRLHGGSTITQQLAKNLLLTPEVSLLRKAREIVLALLIERDLSKDRILELYLNEIYLGRGSYGIGTAAQRYFGVSPSELSLSQAAYLAALPKAPNNYHPVFRHDAAVARRNYVLDRMLEDGAITEEQAAAARAEPLEVRRYAAPETVSAPYFSEEVRRAVRRTLGPDLLYEGGLAVRTTLDPRLQTYAETALRDGLLAYDRRHGWRGPISNMERIVTRQQALEAAVAEGEPASDTNPAEPAAAAGEDAPQAGSGGLFGRLSRLTGDGGSETPAVEVEPEPAEAPPLWQAVLAEIDPPAGARDWRLAVVLEIAPRHARIGLDDGENGRIELDDLSWARRWRSNDWVGPAVSRVSDVLSVGDVILVESLDAVSAEAAAASGRDRRFGLRQVPRIQGAIVVLEPHSGRVLAMAGGYDYGLSEFNRATQAYRQPGSAFKPFVYLAALERGYSPSTVLLDVPVEVEQGALARAWRPQNYGHDFAGALPLRAGVVRSRNVMTVRLLLEMGLEPVANAAERFGIYDDMPLLPAMGLGAGETTLLRLTAAYGMIANGGFRLSPYFIDRIQDHRGRTIFRGDLRACQGCLSAASPERTPPAPHALSERVTDPQTAHQMISILQGVVQRGTAARLASLGLPLAGKTGTTNEARDAWFVGFSPGLVAGVYVGFDEPRTLGRESGSSAAVPIFGAFMERALEDDGLDRFPTPPEITTAWINPYTGEQVAPGSDGAVLEVVPPGTGGEWQPGSRRAGPQNVFRETSDQSLQGIGGLY